LREAQKIFIQLIQDKGINIMATSPFAGLLQNILSGGATLGSAPAFRNIKSGFTLDNKGRLKIDPTTGEVIPPDERRKFKNFAQNPFQIMPGSSLNMNIPNLLGLGGAAMGGGLGNVFARLQGLGGGGGGQQ
jgi:hypothetical protein